MVHERFTDLFGLMPEVARLGWSPTGDTAVNVPGDVTLPKATSTGV